MHRVLPTLALGLSLLSLSACPAKAPPRAEAEAKPPPPPPIRVPPGCESSQAGEYHHAQNPAFRYYGEDDGGTLSLSVVRAQGDGGTEAPDASATSIVLQRTPEGFVGETRATGFTGTGASCPVAFPTEAVACDARGLTLRSAASTAIDEGCRAAPAGAPGVRLEQVLLRGAPDGGM